MRLLVCGAKGMLGSDLVPLLQSNGHDVTTSDIDTLDITDRAAVLARMRSQRPAAVINCAAYTDVDRAETERAAAMAVNGSGVQNLALACAESDAELLHVSTDYVFDGTRRTPWRPLDLPNPLNWYGYSKLAGERFVEWHAPRFYIVRTSWLYGMRGRNFVQTILRLAGEKPELRVVDDQLGSPTHTRSLARAIAGLVGSGRYGIHHYTDSTAGGISWYEFAREIVRLGGLSTPVLPIKTAEMPRPAPRPAYSVLELTLDSVPWREELAAYLAQVS